MEKKEKERSEEPWVGRRILGVAAAGAVAVAAGAFLLLSLVGDKDDQTADDTTARPRKAMKGPGAGGQQICRDKFEEDTSNYFRTMRKKGSKAAVDEFQ